MVCTGAGIDLIYVQEKRSIVLDDGNIFKDKPDSE